MRTTLAIAAATVATYAIGNPMGLALWPIPSEEFHAWQLVTYALVHGNPLHLLMNLVALVSFGPVLERAWGWRRFLACYALAAAVGGAAQALMVTRPVVGASAALFGIFAAYVMDKPKARVYTLWPTPVTAWKLLAVMAVLSVLALVSGTASNIAHMAHLGGAVVGIAFALNNKPRR